MSNINYFYRIDYFGPPPLRGETMGRYGFSPVITRPMARKALQTILPPSISDRLRQRAELVGESLFGSDFKREAHYGFHENTALLRFCRVMGNACSLGLPFGEIETLQSELTKSSAELEEADSFPVRYDSHNVDGDRQAYALCTLWLNWAHTLERLVEKNRT